MSRSISLAIRSLRARPLRTLLTMFAILLGVAVILAINVTNLSTLDSITALFDEASGKAHLVVVSARVETPGFPDEVRYQAGRTPGVAAAVPSLQAQTVLADDASESGMDLGFFVITANGLLLYGVDPALDPQARQYTIVEGNFLPEDGDAYDVVLVKDYADDKDIRVGSEVSIVTPSGVERLRVVGLMTKEGPGRLNNGAFGIIPLGAAQAIFERAGELDQIDVVAAPGQTGGAELDALKAALQAQLGEDYTVTYPAAQGQRVTQMLDTYQLGLSFFSAIALFVGAFLIYNAFSMTVVERTREIGLLRAIGMTRRQVLRQILIEALILGVVGAALGIGAGILLAKSLIRGMEFLLSQEMRLVRVPPEDIAGSTLVGLLVTLAASLLPAWQASHISPLEALRARSKSGEGWFVRRGWPAGAALMAISYVAIYGVPLKTMTRLTIGEIAVFTLFLGATLLIPATVPLWERVTRPLIRGIYGQEGRLGSSNIRRARLRTTLTATALMVGVAMVLGIQGLTGTFKHDIQGWIDAYVGGDLLVYSSGPIRADLARRLEAVEGVEAAAAIRFVDVKRVKPGGEAERIIFMAVDPPAYSRVGSFVFASEQSDQGGLMDRLASGDTVFISSVISEKYGLEPGDSIRLETRRGSHDFAVAAVVVDFYNRGMVVQGSWKDLRRYFGTNDATAFFLKLRPGQSVSQVEQRIKALYGERWHLSVASNEALKSRAMALADRGYSLFNVLGIIAIVVASFGLVNTLTMSVAERTREIGALRGLGMTRRQVRKMIMAEAAMIGLIGGIFGLVFGLFLSRVFLMAIIALRGYELNYVLPVEGIVASVVLAVVISQAAAILPARRAARLRIVEAIQYE